MEKEKMDSKEEGYQVFLLLGMKPRKPGLFMIFLLSLSDFSDFF